MSFAEITTLFAIYRKDLRAKKFNNQSNLGKEKATERQRQFLMDLVYKNGVCITQKELDRMTRDQASKTINTLLGGD